MIVSGLINFISRRTFQSCKRKGLINSDYWMSQTESNADDANLPILEVPILNKISLNDIISEHSLTEYQLKNISIGKDSSIYFLFAESIPERKIQGIASFMPTTSNTKYCVVSVPIDWTNGEIFPSALTNFGNLEQNVHLLQPTSQGFLLLCCRCYYHEEGKEEHNAILANSEGQVIDSFCFGDGIAECIVDSRDRIITSYFDEGVFGNYGWRNPIGSCGLIAWNLKGKQIWQNTEYSIADCYAMNVDDSDNLWFYYYPDFELVKTNFEQSGKFSPGIRGANKIIIKKSGDYVALSGGYGNQGNYYSFHIEEGQLNSQKEKIIFTYGNNPVLNSRIICRGSKIILFDSERNLFLTSWT
jgi:hypothetical protein